jgi:hypothetical protein
MIYDPTCVLTGCANEWNLRGNITAMYGDNCMSQRKTCAWVERLKLWRTNVDDARSEWRLTITYVEVKKEIDQRIRDNLRIITDEVEFLVYMSHEDT